MQIGFNEQCYIELKSETVGSQLQTVGNYHIFIINRRRRALSYISAIIKLDQMKYLTDPENYLLLKRDVNVGPQTENIVKSELNSGNTLLRGALANLLSLDEHTLAIIILTYNFNEDSINFLNSDSQKFTKEKQEKLGQFYVWDNYASIGIKLS